MLVLTFTVYWKWFVNHHNALGQRNEVMPNNAKRKMKKHSFSYTHTHMNTECINGGLLSEELGKFMRIVLVDLVPFKSL